MRIICIEFNVGNSQQKEIIKYLRADNGEDINLITELWRKLTGCVVWLIYALLNKRNINDALLLLSIKNINITTVLVLLNKVNSTTSITDDRLDYLNLLLIGISMTNRLLF